LVRRSEWVPNKDESRPMLAIHSDSRRAYWRVEAAAFAPAAVEQEIAGTIPARRKVLVDRLARLLGNLEPDRKTGLVLPNGRTVDGIAMWRDVLDLEAHHVAATQLAIDREIEERQVPHPPCELQLRPNGPDVLRLQRWLRADQLALIPGSAPGRDNAGLVDGLHGPSPVWSEKAEHAPVPCDGLV
jgi:hypothetical protein